MFGHRGPSAHALTAATAVGLLGLITAGCGGASSPSAGSATAAKTPTAAAAQTGAPSAAQPSAAQPSAAQPSAAQRSAAPLTAAQAKQALLAASDLPTGWKPQPAGPDAGSGGTTTPTHCATLSRPADRLAGASATAQASFAGPGIADKVFDVVAAYPTPAAAKAKADTVAGLLKPCPKYTTDLGGMRLSMSATEVPFQNLGDRTVAVRTDTGIPGGGTAYSEAVLVVVGHTTVSVTLSSFTPVDQGTLQALVTKSLAKLKAASTAGA